MAKKAKYPAQTVLLTTEAIRDEVKGYAEDDLESASEIFRQIIACGLPIYRQERAARIAEGDPEA